MSRLINCSVKGSGIGTSVEKYTNEIDKRVQKQTKHINDQLIYDKDDTILLNW